ncbi:MAG: ABC transporter substrate-binding protein [Sphingomonadales bacterium]|nr:ABC transporter substrate-binding protein [Sphingomonadales bacterium]MBK9267745.1 ABC transporter substrate-binding protein [Sphingomonadales bacterium]
MVEDSPREIAVGRTPLSPASAYLRNATAQGLVAFDSEGRVVPALAARWIVTDDDLGYIFRLQKSRWNDGREIRSDEVAAALRFRIAELRGSRFGNELAKIDRVLPMTGKVVEIRLGAPVPNLLELLAQPEFGLIHKSNGSGPMIAERISGSLHLRNRLEESNGAIGLDDKRVILAAHTPSRALARFALEQTDLVLNGRFEHLPLLTATEGNEANTRFDAVPGLFGLLVTGDGPFLSNAANREAIAMAIDRPRLLTSFGITDWRETLTLAPEALTNREQLPRPTWAGRNVQERKASARSTIAAWEGANGPVRTLRIAMPRGTGSRILFARIRSDLATIGLDAERVTYAQPADLILVDRVADISSPGWYLDQMSCQATPICSEQADRLLDEARDAPAREERIRLWSEAERALIETRNFIPIANPIRWSLVRDGLLGFAQNPRGWHPLQYLGRDPT